MTAIPKGLGKRGAGFWRAGVADFEPGPDDRELLLEVCRTLDLVEELQCRLGEKGMLVEIRLQRQLLARLLIQLGLPDEEGAVMPSPSTSRARRAAEARWAGHVKTAEY